MIDDRSGNAAHPRTHGNTPGDTRCAPTLTAEQARCWNGRPSGTRAERARRGGKGGPLSGEVGEDPEVAAAGAATVVGRVARGLGPGGLTDGVGQREQVVAGRPGVVEVDLVADDLPPPRHGQPL